MNKIKISLQKYAVRLLLVLGIGISSIASSYSQTVPLNHLINNDGGSRIGDVLFYPDGSKLMISSNSMTLWDLDNGEQIRRYDIGSSAGAIAISPDMKQFATATGHRIIRLWDIETGAMVQEFFRDVQSLEPVAFSALSFTPDGNNLVAVADNGEIDIWDITSGEVRVLIDTSPSRNLQFFNDGERILVGGRVISLSTGEILFSIPVNNGVVLSTDSTKLYVLTQRSVSSGLFYFSILDANRYTLINEYPPYETDSNRHEISPSGNYIASSGSESTIPTARLINSMLGDVTRTFVNSMSDRIQPRFFEFSPDGNKLATVKDNTVYLYDLSDLKTAIPNAQLYDN